MTKQTLRVSVCKQEISQPPSTKIIAGSRNYLYVQFLFQGWSNVEKTAIFEDWGGKAYSVLLDASGSCLVPHEVIKAPGFKLSVFGGDLITTNKITIPIEVSGYRLGVAPPEPTPDIFTQLADTVRVERELAQSASNSAHTDALQTGSDREVISSLAVQMRDDAAQTELAYQTVKAMVDLVEDATIRAENFEGGAQVAYSNTMQAIGTSVCPLVGGKVPVSSIPLSVAHNVVEITNKAELTALTSQQVQLNDVAVIISGTGENKQVNVSYQLLGTGDPSIQENWVEVGTSHASTAAYSIQSDTALNASGLGGHTVVVIGESEYAGLSSKPSGVLYLVFPDAAFGRG